MAIAASRVPITSPGLTGPAQSADNKPNAKRLD
jgi:hypothetical protein